MFFEKLRIYEEREIRFCGIPILQYGSRNLVGVNSHEKYIRLFHKSLEHQFLDRILSLISKEHDAIFLIRSDGLGESYLFNFLLEELKEKHKIKNACVVSHKRLFRDVISMWHQIPFYHDRFCNLHVWNQFLLRPFYKYRGRKFFVYAAPVKQIKDAMGMASNAGRDIHYTDQILRFCNCDHFSYVPPQIKDAVWETMLKKTEHINKEKFVFFIPEAKSTSLLPEQFWRVLSEEFEKLGFDVYANSVRMKITYAKHANLSLQEAYALASLSKGIISLRCGLTEILSTLPVPKHVLYTHYKVENCSADHILNRTSILRYPSVIADTIFEYSSENTDIEQIIERIISHYK